MARLVCGSKVLGILKHVELMLISELMKNSRVSDRELAKRLGISQPTVSRTRSKLEKEGYVGEYTLIPNFAKLGFQIMAVSFVRYSELPSEEKIKKLRDVAQELQRKSGLMTIMGMNGTGLGYDRILISLHEDYSSYSRFLTASKELAVQGIADIGSFIIDLTDKTHFQPLTMATLGDYLLKKR